MKGNNLIKILLVLIVFTFIFHQFYSSLYKPITTENADFYEAVEGTNITGVIIRNEQLVSCDTAGVYHYLLEDGTRVSKGGTIADIYDNEKASITMSEIDHLNEQISDITDLQHYNSLQATDLNLINNRVDTALNGLVKASSNGNYSQIIEYTDELESAYNRRLMFTGEQTDFSERLAQLNNSLAEKKASLPNSKGSIKSDLSGYFSTSVDGYEKLFEGLTPEKISVDFIDNMKPQTIEKNIVGKIVSDYEWYIAAKVDINESMKYKVGQTLKIRTSIYSSPELDVKVAAINISEDKNNAVVVFSCDRMTKELAAMRTGPMTVVNAVHSGLKVAKSALRVVDSQTGVYVVSGITLSFVKVDVIYSNDEYMICKQEQSTDKVLRLYDEVVVKGRKLYDGKIVG